MPARADLATRNRRHTPSSDGYSKGLTVCVILNPLGTCSLVGRHVFSSFLTLSGYPSRQGRDIPYFWRYHYVKKQIKTGSCLSKHHRHDHRRHCSRRRTVENPMVRSAVRCSDQCGDWSLLSRHQCAFIGTGVQDTGLLDSFLGRVQPVEESRLQDSFRRTRYACAVCTPGRDQNQRWGFPPDTICFLKKVVDRFWTDDRYRQPAQSVHYRGVHKEFGNPLRDNARLVFLYF